MFFWTVLNKDICQKGGVDWCSVNIINVGVALKMDIIMFNLVLVASIIQ